MSVFLKTRKKADASIDNETYRLLDRAGFIDRTSSGVYSFTHLGVRLLESICEVVSDEMDAVGRRVDLSSLQSREIWEKSGRWGNLEGEMFTVDGRDSMYCLSATNEEVATEFMKSYIESYRDLEGSQVIYQISKKYRDDHANRGIVRTKEFYMKDAYSFHKSSTQLDEVYSDIRDVYHRVFDRLGIEYMTVSADTGTIGGSHSEEFIAISDDGKETLIDCDGCGVVRKVEGDRSSCEQVCQECGCESVRVTEGIEIGHIFKLGTKYSDSHDLTYTTMSNEESVVHMGCYGIGVTRVLHCLIEQNSMGSSIDLSNSEAGTFDNAILVSDGIDGDIIQQLEAELGYQDTLVYTTEYSLGEQFAETDLLGIETKYIFGNTYKNSGKIEIETADKTEYETVEGILE